MKIYLNFIAALFASIPLLLISPVSQAGNISLHFGYNNFSHYSGHYGHGYGPITYYAYPMVRYYRFPGYFPGYYYPPGYGYYKHYPGTHIYGYSPYNQQHFNHNRMHHGHHDKFHDRHHHHKDKFRK